MQVMAVSKPGQRRYADDAVTEVFGEYGAKSQKRNHLSPGRSDDDFSLGHPSQGVLKGRQTVDVESVESRLVKTEHAVQVEEEQHDSILAPFGAASGVDQRPGDMFNLR